MVWNWWFDIFTIVQFLCGKGKVMIYLTQFFFQADWINTTTERFGCKHARTSFALAMGSVLPAAKKARSFHDDRNLREGCLIRKPIVQKFDFSGSWSRGWWNTIIHRWWNTFQFLKIFLLNSWFSFAIMVCETGFILLEFLLPSKSCSFLIYLKPWHCSGQSPTWRIIPGLVSG